MSTEIICQGGFCPEISVTSRINPYTAFLHSLFIIPNLASRVKRLNEIFLIFLKIFEKDGKTAKIPFFCFFSHVHSHRISSLFIYTRMRACAKETGAFTAPVSLFAFYFSALYPQTTGQLPRHQSSQPLGRLSTSQ